MTVSVADFGVGTGSATWAVQPPMMMKRIGKIRSDRTMEDPLWLG